jgi:ribose transport system substrate-binding protein
VNTLRTALSLLLPLALFACGDSGSPAVSTVAASVTRSSEAQESPAAQRKWKVGLVMKTLTNPFFIEMEKGARRAEQELGVELVLKTGAEETSIEQQLQLIEDLIASQADAIVIAPGDSHSLIPALKKAAERGIKLINIDNRLDPQAVHDAGLAPIPLVSVDNERGAYAATRSIANGAKPGTQAAIIEGIRGADNAQQRKAGARRAFAENKAIVLVAEQTANWKIDEGYAVTQAIFASHPQVGLIFAANDMMALGALKYLEESGRRGVKVAAFDALAEAVAEIKSGRLAATVDQRAAEQGYQGVRLAVKQLQGEAVAAQTLVETELLTGSAGR